jgi:hypothetical protein
MVTAMLEQGSFGSGFVAGTAADRGLDGRRRRYAKPRLEHYGDVRGLTMGGSPGIGDSGIGDPHDPLGGFRGPPFPPAG